MSLLLALSALSFTAPDAQAQSAESLREAGNFGIGVGGLASGLSSKYWLTDRSALQATVASSGIISETITIASISLGVDYLVEMPVFADSDAVEVAWNFGGGGFLSPYLFGGSKLEGADTSALPTASVGDGGVSLFGGISGVAGLEFNFRKVPIDIVLEYRPSLFVLDATPYFAWLGGSSQVRYYFG